jgi:hypothetical protein
MNSKELLLLRCRRTASLVSFVPSDEDIAAAGRRSKALPVLQGYHVFLRKTSEQRPWFQAEYDLAARKMRLAEFRLFLNSRHSELNLRRVGAEVEKPYS